MLTAGEVKELKEQLLEQIKHLPQDQREAAQEQIENMSSEAIEAMLIDQQRHHKKNVMRMIVDGEINARKIAENSDAIAVLEIKPLVKGHTIIIPKKKTGSFSSFSEKTRSLAREAGIKLANKLETEGFSLDPEMKFGEAIINVLPYHSDKKIDSNSRYDASQEELEEVFDKVTHREQPIVKEMKEEKKENLVLKRRIP